MRTILYTGISCWFEGSSHTSRRVVGFVRDSRGKANDGKGLLLSIKVTGLLYLQQGGTRIVILILVVYGCGGALCDGWQRMANGW